MKKLFKTAGLYILIVILVIVFAQSYLFNKPTTKKLNFNQFVSQLEAEKIK